MLIKDGIKLVQKKIQAVMDLQLTTYKYPGISEKFLGYIFRTTDMCGRPLKTSRK